jgi:hypothetical protein
MSWSGPTAIGSVVTATTGATIVFTTNVDTPVGSLLIVAVSAGDLTTTAGTISDSAGNFSSLAATTSIGVGTGVSAIWAVVTTVDLPSGGTITYTRGGTPTNCKIGAVYFSNTAGIPKLDQTTTPTSGVSTPITITAATAAQTGNLNVGFGGGLSTNASTLTQTGTFTNIPTLTSGDAAAGQTMIGGFQVNAGTSGLTFSASFTGVANWGGLLLTFTSYVQVRAPLYVPRPPEDQPWGPPRSIPVSLLARLTQQKIYGQGGQVPRARWNFNYDETPIWVGAPRSSNISTIPPAVNPFKNKNTYWFSEDAVWQGTPIDSALLHPLLTSGGQVKPFRWNYTLDDQSIWQGVPIDSALLHPLLTAGGQVPPFRWNFTWDDHAVWQGVPIDSALLHPLLTAGGQVPPARWNFNYDEAASWQLFIDRNTNLYPPVAAQNPLTVRWFSSSDDTPTWQWTPSNVAIVLPPTPNPFTSRPPQWYSEDAFWQGGPNRSAIIRLLTVGGQPPTPHYQFNYDDAPGWQGAPTGKNPNLVPPLQAPFSNRQTYWYSEDSLWQGASTGRNQNLVSVGTSPFSNRQTYWYDDPSIWAGAPLNSQIISLLTRGGKPLPPFRPNLTYDEASSWTGVPISSQTIKLLTAFNGGRAFPRLLWNYGLDSGESYWAGQISLPSLNLVLLTTTIAFPTVRSGHGYLYSSVLAYDSGEAPGWVGTPLAAPNTVNPIPPPIVITGDYTVSGLDVRDLFQVYDVVYTQPGHLQLITKRTN